MQDIAETPHLPPSFRILKVLEVLAEQGRPMTATEINASLKLPVPTIHRLVGNLEAEGFLSRHLDGRSYQPGPKLRRMTRGVLRFWHQNLTERAILTRLNERLGETCNLAIPDGDAMLYIDRVETRWPLRVQLHVGSRVPLHATASGKLSLSSMTAPQLARYLKTARLESYTPHTITDPERLRDELQQVASQGYATDSQEFVSGMIAVAVPVRDPSSHLLATVSFHAPEQRMSLDSGLRHLPDLFAAAEEMAQLI